VSGSPCAPVSSPTPDILWFPTTLRRDPLDAAGLERVRQTTFDILEQVGVRFPSAGAREVFRKHGAKVDDASGVVLLAPDLVEGALATAPRSFVLAGREPRFDLTLDGSCTYLCTEGVGVRVRDPQTGAERPSRKADVELMARVVDALPLIGFFWAPVSAQDHPLTAPLHECHAGLVSTLKHVRGGTTVHPRLASRIVEMATVVAGSDEACRARPPVCANICTISPLGQDETGIEAALVYAEAGIPTSFMAMPTMGSTAPASVLGGLAVGEAEVVSAMVLVQLAFPGAPVFHSNLISLMDPHSGGYLAELDAAIETMPVQLAHSWGVPNLGGASLSSDASVAGWSAGSRAGAAATMLAFCGAEIAGDMGGLLEGATVLEPHVLVLQHDAALAAWDAFAGGGEVGDDGERVLAVVADVGPRGHFLSHKHTRQHLRDFRLTLAQRPRPRAASSEGGGGEAGTGDAAVAAARDEFARLAAEHHPEPLPDDVLAELDRILAEAEREAERLAR